MSFKFNPQAPIWVFKPAIRVVLPPASAYQKKPYYPSNYGIEITSAPSYLGHPEGPFYTRYPSRIQDAPMVLNESTTKPEETDIESREKPNNESNAELGKPVKDEIVLHPAQKEAISFWCKHPFRG
ncbi:hypothetical protein DFH27DRAFT_609675 [Peziza echinospora]|nr:hypothetical protein DFH27DRAFT_609675 [Peziza echinospora]